MATRLPEPTFRRFNSRSTQQQGTTAGPIPPASRPRSSSQSSNDSQTVVLSHKDAKESTSPSPTPQLHAEASAEENLHCWICLMDEPVTEREAGNWRSPCSCNLTAHEECLFQWIVSLWYTPFPILIQTNERNSSPHRKKTRSFVRNAKPRSR